jgi:hypothetical protein
MKVENDYSLSFIQRINGENFPVTDDIMYNNFFIVKFPESMGIRYYDVISVHFLNNNVCRFVIRNNYTTYPLYHLNKSKCWLHNIFKVKKENIEIIQLRKNMEPVYKNVLTNIRVKNIYEAELSYKSDGVQEIMFDVKYSKRILSKYGSTNQEGEQNDK